MTFLLVNRVRETTISPGTGTATLAGAALGYQTFSAGVGANNTTYYVIADQNGANWEVGYGTVGSGGTTLARTTVLSSSNAGSLVNFSSGTQDVWVDYPANKAVFQDSTGTVSVPVLLTTSTTSTTPNLSFNASNTGFAVGASVSGSYLQSLLQNKSGTAGASANYVLSNDLGTDSTYYGEFGMNSSVYSASTPSDFFSINNGIYFSGHDGDITFGSGNGFKSYFAWGSSGQSAHVINAVGALGFSTNLGTTPALSGTTGYGTSGQVPISAGSAGAVSWSSTPTLTGTNFTGVPISTAISGLGTGVASALAIAIGSAGAPVTFNGALGTPSSGTLTNCTFPTLNQNTTGQAGSVANSHTAGTGLSGSTFNGSAAVTWTLATAYGDSINPYASKTANYFLAAPNGSAGAPTFRAIVAADIPTLNQNTTGTAANVTGIVALANGGSGQTTAQAAMNAFAGAVTSGSYLRGNGTNVVMSTIQAADVPTLNQNTTGTASNITGTYTGSISSSQVTTGLGYTPYNSSNPSGYISSITSGMVTTALGYTPYNSSNPNSYIALSSAITGYTAGTNTALVATDTLLAALGKLQGQVTARGTGTVTSVSATAGTGISVSGSPITTSGTLTITNTGVTSVAAGTGISVSATTGGVTITNSAPATSQTQLKAWANWSGGNPPTIRSSYNISSITWITTGEYQISFSTAFSNANYCSLVLGGFDDATNTLMGAKTFSVSAGNLYTRFFSAGTSNYYDLPINNFMATGA